jgi:drug/metabolite transporter (DMT)-like permease
MSAFAGNSILCRLALKGTATDPASFTVVRIVAGAVVLAVLVRLRGGERLRTAASWAGAVALSLYAVAFSFAYVRLSAGGGALLLFGAVQSSLLGYGLCKGERLSALALAGFATSIAGLLFLLLPGSSAPHLASAFLMVCAGAAWAWYTVLGRSGGDALRTTAGSFLRAVPIVVAVAVPFLPVLRIDASGALCAALSGAVASGIGYTIWYQAVPHLSALRASAVQLSVPVLSAVAGVVLLAEPLTLRLGVASVAVLGGIALVLAARERAR